MPHDESGVDRLKDKLYSRKGARGIQDVRAPLTPSEAHAPVKWEGELAPRAPRIVAEPTPKERMALATKFLIGSVIFFVVAIAGAALFFFNGGNYISPQNIDVQIVAPTLIDGGTQAALTFLVTNRNTAELQLADLVVMYPEGTRDPKSPEKALTSERLSIGAIPPGRQVKLTSSAVFYGSEGVMQDIKARLEYSIQGSNAVFIKEGVTSLTIGSSPVSLRIEAPQEAISGQQFTVNVTVQSNATEPVQDVLVQAQYPFGFAVRSASPKADAGSTVWRIGTMTPGTSKVITIVGVIDGQDGDERVFRFAAGTNKDQTAGKIEVPFLSIPVSLTVQRPFITATIAVDGKTGAKISAAGGAPLAGTISWKNNLTESVTDMQVKIKLTGPALDRSSITSGNGFYQSNDSTITWTSAQEPSLAQVAPGSSGTLQFTFSTLSPGTGGVVYTNPTIDLSLTVGGVRSGQDNVPDQVTSAAFTQVTIASAVSLAARALHFTGAFTNSGPMPPRAETPTHYTIEWIAKNSSNAIAGAVVSTVLPTYVSFVGAAQGSGISYEASSRTVRWDAGDLKAGVGYSTSARSASFQVLFAPSASQVGLTPALTGTTALTGTDRFAQVAVSAIAEAPTIKLVENGFVSGMDIVQQKQ
jgi:hypothetical protein